MAYFDSPKNKALWDKELESLDAERERRKETGYRPQREGGSSGNGADAGSYLAGSEGNPKVRRITLKELEDIERRATGRQTAPGREHVRARQARVRTDTAQKTQSETALV